MPKSESTKSKYSLEGRTRLVCKRNIDHALHCLANASALRDRHLDDFTWDERESVIRAVFLVKEIADKYGDSATTPDDNSTVPQEES